MIAVTIQNVLYEAYKKWENKAYVYQKENGVFVPKTFGKTILDILALSEELISLGFYDKKIMIYAENSYGWLVTDLAIMGYVGINVSVNKEWKFNDIDNVLKYTDVDLIIYSNTNNIEVINQIKEKYKNIKYISFQDDFENILQSGHEKLAKKREKFDFNRKDPEETCKIMFSSGTTADPKASMLTQVNMFSGWENFKRRVVFTSDDVCFLFLPMFHTYGGIYNVLYSFLAGCKLYICSDNSKIVEEIKEVEPTGICAVPLIFERIYNSIDKKTLRLLYLLICVSNFLRVFGIDIRKRLFKKIHILFGRNLKYISCAGAKFDYKIKKFFNNIGLPVLEAYALTETASSFTLEYPRKHRNNSVGEIYEDIDVKIVKDGKSKYGEIIVKGKNVCKGYYKNEKANKEAFDENGYFHTGDLGYIDSKNRLYLIGRKRRVITLNNGENIYPDEIEQIIMRNEEITKVKVFEKDKQLHATVYVKENMNIDIDEVIRNTNKILSTYKQVKEYDIIKDTVNARFK